MKRKDEYCAFFRIRLSTRRISNELEDCLGNDYYGALVFPGSLSAVIRSDQIRLSHVQENTPYKG